MTDNSLFAWGWSGFGQAGTGQQGGHLELPTEVLFRFGAVDAADAPRALSHVAAIWCRGTHGSVRACAHRPSAT